MKLLEAHFQKQVRVFNRLVRVQAKRLTIEGVHDLRVSTRRLRSLVWLLDKNTDQKVPGSIKSSLKTLGHALGQRRQWDVARVGARKYHLQQARLIKNQQKTGDELKNMLKSPELAGLTKTLREMDKALKNKNVNIQPATLKKMKSEVRQWLHTKNLSRKQMHQLRIMTKKIRYIFEALALPVEDLKELQDRLGKSHDLTMLNDYFHAPKAVKKDEKQEHKKAQKQIRPALRSSLDVLKSLR